MRRSDPLATHVADDRRKQPDRRTVRPGCRYGRRATDDPPPWLSLDDYARTYGVTTRHLRALIADGKLDAYRSGPLIRIRNLPPVQHRG